MRRQRMLVASAVLCAMTSPSWGTSHEVDVAVRLKLDARGCVERGWPVLDEVTAELTVKDREQAVVHWKIEHLNVNGAPTNQKRKQALRFDHAPKKASANKPCGTHLFVGHTKTHFEHQLVPSATMLYSRTEPEDFQRSRGYWLVHNTSCYGYKVTALEFRNEKDELICRERVSDPKIIIRDGGGNGPFKNLVVSLVAGTGLILALFAAVYFGRQWLHAKPE